MCLYFVYLSGHFGIAGLQQGIGYICKKISMTTALTLELNIAEGRGYKHHSPLLPGTHTHTHRNTHTQPTTKTNSIYL